MFDHYGGDGAPKCLSHRPISRVPRENSSGSEAAHACTVRIRPMQVGAPDTAQRRSCVRSEQPPDARLACFDSHHVRPSASSTRFPFSALSGCCNECFAVPLNLPLEAFSRKNPTQPCLTARSFSLNPHLMPPQTRAAPTHNISCSVHPRQAPGLGCPLPHRFFVERFPNSWEPGTIDSCRSPTVARDIYTFAAQLPPHVVCYRLYELHIPNPEHPHPQP